MGPSPANLLDTLNPEPKLSCGLELGVLGLGFRAWRYWFLDTLNPERWHG